MTWNPYETKPPEITSQGTKFFFKICDREWELEWSRGENSDDASSWIRPYHPIGYSTECPDWFPNEWPRFHEIIEPTTAQWMLETFKKAYEQAYNAGSRDRAHRIRAELGIK